MSSNPQVETTKKVEHVPGPWTKKRTAVYDAIYGPNDELVSFVGQRDDGGATSNLLDAAPDMLDALQDVYPLTCKGADPIGDSCGVTFPCHHCRLNAIIPAALSTAECGQ